MNSTFWFIKNQTNLEWTQIHAISFYFLIGRDHISIAQMLVLFSLVLFDIICMLCSNVSFHFTKSIFFFLHFRFPKKKKTLTKIEFIKCLFKIYVLRPNSKRSLFFFLLFRINNRIHLCDSTNCRSHDVCTCVFSGWENHMLIALPCSVLSRQTEDKTRMPIAMDSEFFRAEHRNRRRCRKKRFESLPKRKFRITSHLIFSILFFFYLFNSVYGVNQKSLKIG